jgi:hypothetical protein
MLRFVLLVVGVDPQQWNGCRCTISARRSPPPPSSHPSTPGQSNADFVASLYQNGLGRTAEAAGATLWTGQLDSGAMTRGDTVIAFASLSEGSEWLGLLVDQEATLRQQRRFEARTRTAKLRQAATVRLADNGGAVRA